MGEVKLIHNHYLEPRDASVDEISPTGNSKVGDFIGFTYNGKHSSELGIVRTSDGSRFNENLLPTMQDKTVQVPGADGTYYFGSYYTQRQFNVSFAFDDLTEFQVAQLKSHFGDKGIHDLIFDECPYKVYSAKVTGTATIKYIAFSEGSTNRLYKGEGGVQFTCYNPFARSRYKFLDDYLKKDYPNKIEWKNASGMRSNNQYVYQYENENVTRVIDEWGNSTGKETDPKDRFLLFNPGDKESDWILTIPFVENTIPAINISLAKWPTKKISLSEIKSKGLSTKIKINSKTNLIEGYDNNNQKTGELYNYCLISGEFFKIPIIKKTQPNTDNDNFSSEALVVRQASGGPISNAIKPELKYDYYYY